MNELTQTPETTVTYFNDPVENAEYKEIVAYYDKTHADRKRNPSSFNLDRCREWRPFDHTKYRKGTPVEVNGFQFVSMKHLKDFSYYLLSENTSSFINAGSRLDKFTTDHFKALFKLANVDVDNYEDLILWKTELREIPRSRGTVSGVMYLRKDDPDMQIRTIDTLINIVSRVLYPYTKSKIQGKIQQLKRWNELPKEYTEEQILRVMKGEPESVVFEGQEMYDWHGERQTKYYNKRFKDQKPVTFEEFFGLGVNSQEDDEPLPF